MDNRKIAIYSRKSKFTGKGESIENQIELCKAYIRSKNIGIKDEDIGVDNKNMAVRPAMWIDISGMTVD